MRKLFNIVVLLLLLGGFWYGYGNDIQESGFKAGVRSFASDVRSLINGPEVSTALDKLNTGVNYLIGELTETLDNASKEEQPETEQVKKPTLEAPAEASFSVHNIEIGDTKFCC